MSAEQKRALIDQIAGILAVANATPEMMFEGDSSAETIATAGSNLDNILDILWEHRASLSVPQTIWNTRAAHMDVDRLMQSRPDLIRQAELCPFNPQSGHLIGAASRDVVPGITQGGMILDIFNRQTLAASAPIFTFPKGMMQEDVEDLCSDINLLLACYRETWEDFYQDRDGEIAPPIHRSKGGCLGYHGAMQWVANLIEAVREETGRHASYIDAAGIPKTGVGKLKPPAAQLN